MKKFSSRKLAFILLPVVIGVFLIAFLVFYFTRSSFPDPGIRNRDYTIAKLDECANRVINADANYIDPISFNNGKDNIHVQLSTDFDATISITGYVNDTVKEKGTMTRLNNNTYQFTFNFDYFDINKIDISLDKAIYVREVNVFYIR